MGQRRLQYVDEGAERRSLAWRTMSGAAFAFGHAAQMNATNYKESAP
jgi:hypothetical protein